MIQVRDLSKSFGEGDKRMTVLDRFNADFETGKITSILGGSGSGKSTVLKHLIGAYRPDSGEIRIDGENVVGLDEEGANRVRKKFGIMFQSGALFNSLNVEDNVALPLREHTRLNESTIRIMVKMKLEMVGLRGAEHLKPAQLSGGMIKRIALARAIALDPKIVFYDEPSAGLDPISIGVIDKLIMDLSRKMRITSVVVTHEIPSAMRISDKIIMLYKGQIIASGSPDEIRHSDDPRVQQFINGSPDGPIPFSKSQKDYAEELKEMSVE
ncbi:MAG: ABC transporter ATP-binding protein [Nitrospinae bacterium CG11_big_fil_rev_8_21_14_0_20_56_8]|nr:MAG: ABC transporter ATP-binding protein [Nitrospinae bacterium CG11_big_fil_rev_8_21_14_0_20_56_8]